MNITLLLEFTGYITALLTPLWTTTINHVLSLLVNTRSISSSRRGRFITVYTDQIPNVAAVPYLNLRCLLVPAFVVSLWVKGRMGGTKSGFSKSTYQSRKGRQHTFTMRNMIMWPSEENDHTGGTNPAFTVAEMADGTLSQLPHFSQCQCHFEL